jgi:hypothetical protein
MPLNESADKLICLKKISARIASGKYCCLNEYRLRERKRVGKHKS